MPDQADGFAVADKVNELILDGFSPRFGELRESFPENSAWRRLHELGTALWLDTGSVEEASALWTQEFDALTTNNTLLNREVQTGAYDSLIVEVDRLLSSEGLDTRERILEIAFVLNARHGLKLVEQFDAMVSVELHTDLAGDLDRTVATARRYHAICPERFIIKVPFTAAGLLATRILSSEGIPVNHTLGFSARQNYVIARAGDPAYVNVFMGRLNSFVADNHLGDGTYVGERATLASQSAVRHLCDEGRSCSRQIGASFRNGRQVLDLAGMDVMTMPPKVAADFLDVVEQGGEIADRTGADYRPPLADGVDPAAVRLGTLWDIGPEVVSCVDALVKENLEGFSPAQLIGFFAEFGCSDLLVDWCDESIAINRAEGKIPSLDNWRDMLAEGTIGLDSLMNLAGLNAFRADQQAMDDRIAGMLT